MVEDEAVQQVAVTRRDRSSAGGTPSSAIILAVGPLIARPPMIGEIATTGARQAAIAARMPGTARIGSMLMNGFDGQITTASSCSLASAAQSAGVGRASAAPWNSKPVTFGAHRRATK